MISVLVEAMVGFDDIRAATLNPTSFAQLTFAFDVTVALLVQGLIYAVALGLIGGLLPRFRAARLRIVRWLREVRGACCTRPWAMRCSVNRRSDPRRPAR